MLYSSSCGSRGTQVGSDGVLSIESSNTMETVVEVQEGMLIDRGFISREMITNQVTHPSITFAPR